MPLKVFSPTRNRLIGGVSELNLEVDGKILRDDVVLDDVDELGRDGVSATSLLTRFIRLRPRTR